MRTRTILATMVAVALVVATVATAAEGRRGGGQRPGGQRGAGGPGGPGGFGGGFMGGGPGGGLAMLLTQEAVIKELQLSEEQIGQLKNVREELRGQRGGEDRPNFREMSDEQRAKAMEEMRQRSEQQAKVVREKLDEILLPHQMDRLQQISIQAQGTAALNNPEVAAKLNLTDEQRQKLRDIQRENMEAMRGAFTGGGDREGARERFTTMRQENERKVLAVLNDEQKRQFEEMKGEPFEMPRGAGFGGGQRGGQRGGGTR